MKTERALHKKLNDMTDQMQVLEMEKGCDYLVASKAYQKYEALIEQYEKMTGHPFRYGRD
jgi:hypothetical protein